MQNTIGQRKSNAVSTAAKARGKKKRASLALPTSQEQPPPYPQQQQSSNSARGRRKSVPDEWDPMGCNFRVDTARAHYQKNEIRMPEIHHGIATSSMPIPLNTIMKTWKNVPKLHQYQPSELQVVYHRRTGTTETVVKPEPVKPPEGDFEILRNHNHIVNTLSPGAGVVGPDDPGSNFPVPLKLFDHEGLNPKVAILDTPEIIQNNAGNRIQPGDDELQMLPSQERAIATVTNSINQTDFLCTTSTSFCQTEIKGESSVECQTDKRLQIPEGLKLLSERNKSTTITNDCETQTFNDTGGGGGGDRSSLTSSSGAIIMKKFCENQYQCRASQTEPLNLTSNFSSQSTSIAAQTMDHSFETDLKMSNNNNNYTSIRRSNKGVGTESISFNMAAVQVDHQIASNECGSQTEIDIETPPICLMCDCKQLQIEEIEENMVELQDRFKAMECELLASKNNVVQQIAKMPSPIPGPQLVDASTNTRDPLPQQSTESQTHPVDQVEWEMKCITLKQENEQLKATIQTLQMQLNSFQFGLKRLRTAIEKPIIEDSNISEETIQEVLHKADDFILNCNNSQSRALKINDHLSVLNTCVSVANGIMNENSSSKLDSV